jgi:hypothetical protein
MNYIEGHWPLQTVTWLLNFFSRLSVVDDREPKLRFKCFCSISRFVQHKVSLFVQGLAMISAIEVVKYTILQELGFYASGMYAGWTSSW